MADFDDGIGCPTSFFKKIKRGGGLRGYEKCIVYMPREMMFKFADIISKGNCKILLCHEISSKITKSTIHDRKVKEIILDKG